mmetsp:Transcript_45213/g.79600  ORF Transcript_45213/g.79600 Transcript_45213/m.79600 type:complete len:387 (-) Transcript_45213:725-1885(-)
MRWDVVDCCTWRRLHLRPLCFLVCPVHISLWGEAEEIRRPQLLETCWSLAVLPSPVATHWSHVRVVLRGDWAGLPAIPHTNPSPRWLARVGHQHTLARRTLHYASCQQNTPADQDDQVQSPNSIPWEHVDILHGVVIFHGLHSFLRCLHGSRRGHQVLNMLESCWEPGWVLARSTEVLAALNLLCVAWQQVCRARDHVETDHQSYLHEDAQDRHRPRDVDDQRCWNPSVLKGQSCGRHQWTASLDWEAAASFLHDVNVEDEPQRSREQAGHDAGTPNHAKLCDHVDHEPIAETMAKVNEANEHADTPIHFGSPPVLLGIADDLKVLVRLFQHFISTSRGGHFRILVIVRELLVDPVWHTRPIWHANSLCATAPLFFWLLILALRSF